MSHSALLRPVVVTGCALLMLGLLVTGCGGGSSTSETGGGGGGGAARSRSCSRRRRPPATRRRTAPSSGEVEKLCPDCEILYSNANQARANSRAG